MYIKNRKPIKCPHCGERPVARILYGMPIMSAELERDLFEGTVVLGGCCIKINNPTWQCSVCNTPIYRKQDMDEYDEV